ncbi:MAG: class I SAM-dependent methyltransferase [Deltaproteobacteria bacterium]|nr:class I SAM-dependent methyltransferase [Deltaproteobacteria bacterium]
MTGEELRQAAARELEFRTTSYAEAKEHAARLDKLLGLDIASIELDLLEAESEHQASDPEARPQQRWIGFAHQTFLTPYTELVELTRELAPKAGELWVDLGAAYGRLGVVLGLRHPETRFVGYELVEPRVAAGRALFDRLALPHATLLVQDLVDPTFAPPEADVYFIYDFGTQHAVEKSLHDLQQIARKRPITVVARGRGARSWIERGHPWLASVNAPVHHAHYSVYKS